jgi:hypothetical protein
LWFGQTHRESRAIPLFTWLLIGQSNRRRFFLNELRSPEHLQTSRGEDRFCFLQTGRRKDDDAMANEALRSAGYKSANRLEREVECCWTQAISAMKKLSCYSRAKAVARYYPNVLAVVGDPSCRRTWSGHENACVN